MLQKGRQRQFHQFGVEAIGSDNPEQDAEVISIGWSILNNFGINELEFWREGDRDQEREGGRER